MKSNKEFLEGVYKKAEEIESLNNVDEKKRFFTINLKTAVAAAAVIAFIPLSLKVLEGVDNPSTKGVPERYIMMEEGEEGAKIESYGLHNMISSSSLIATGEVSSIEEDTIYINISYSLKGEPLEDIIKVSNSEEIAINLTEEVLVFLREGEASGYILTEGSNSLFKLYTVIDNNKIFKSPEGFELTLEEVDNLIRGG
ncbi:hypothetical protein ACPWSR_06020 [Alloiococcus sp. CFN-8]|uniref:hypothetical protein n=1 Tax=Alloiococcus sp. CFN-8 TaxID=3416081 RepID=UPI003CFBA993